MSRKPLDYRELEQLLVIAADICEATTLPDKNIVQATFATLVLAVADLLKENEELKTKYVYRR